MTLTLKEESFPFICVDNWFTKEEEENIWKEIDFYYSIAREQLVRAEKSKTTATFIDGSPKAYNLRLYFSLWYKHENLIKSHINNLSSKFKSDNFLQAIEKIKQFRNFKDSKLTTNFISCYEMEDDKYDTHYDNSLFTALVWFYKKPKKFKGGDFIFNDFNKKIDLLHNRMCIFPSWYNHAVTPIKWKNKKFIKGEGRYTLTYFFNHLG
jgi:Rps23 Pro-64 3,4-dihydroxylase Tpa1-like proline 4-hydroxylase